MQYKSLIRELIEVANRLDSNNDGCVPVSIMADGRDCKDCNCDDCLIDVARYIRDLADRLALAHKAKLKTLKKCYKTDLREAREARDVAIKEAAELRDHDIDNSSNADAERIGKEYRKTLVKIGCMLGFDDGELPVMPEILIDELDKRLMPPGMEWPRFEDGEKVNIGDYILHDGKSERVQGIYFYKTSVTLSLTGVDHEKLHTIKYGERVKRPLFNATTVRLHRLRGGAGRGRGHAGGYCLGVLGVCGADR